MKITADLLLHHLSLSHTVSHMGKNLLLQELSLPEFYTKDTEPEKGRLYVARTRDLPQTCSVPCVFLCVGNRPSQHFLSWSGMVLLVEDRDADLISVFNHTQRFFDLVGNWERSMQQLLDEDAPIEEFVKKSLPLFNNSITITDYNLRILANALLNQTEGDKTIQISNDYDWVPDAASKPFLDVAAQYATRREPFFVKGQMADPEGVSYCINLYLGNTYFGTCTLWEQIHPITECDKTLFQSFANYIRQALSSRSGATGSQIATLKTIIDDLLHSFPVSGSDMEWAINLVQKNAELQGITLGTWHCLAIKSANRDKTLPSEYLCRTIETMLPHAIAIAFEDYIACFCMLPEGDTLEDATFDILSPYLRDMNFRAGISEGFHDLFHVKDRFHQAAAILETGLRYAPEQFFYRFADYVLPYMLRHSRGEFDMDYLLTNGMTQLKALDSNVDYWETLRLYLENECNASKTAQDLYLHRSSLLPRIDKIRSLVDLDTPEDRLYARICIALDNYEKSRQK